MKKIEINKEQLIETKILDITVYHVAYQKPDGTVLVIHGKGIDICIGHNNKLKAEEYKSAKDYYLNAELQYQ